MCSPRSRDHTVVKLVRAARDRVKWADSGIDVFSDGVRTPGKNFLWSQDKQGSLLEQMFSKTGQ